jgi:hypothetical protein
MPRSVLIERLRRIASDLAGQAADLHVDGATEDVVVVQPGKVEHLIASENAFRGPQNATSARSAARTA